MRLTVPALAVLCLTCSQPSPPEERTPPSTAAPAPAVNGIASVPTTDTSGDWTRPGLDYAGSRFSSLDQITIESVKQLGVKGTFSTGFLRGHEAAPLVANNTMYIVTPFPNIVYALDLNPSILTEDAEFVYFGPYMQYMSGVADTQVKWILENRSDNPGDRTAEERGNGDDRGPEVKQHAGLDLDGHGHRGHGAQAHDQPERGIAHHLGPAREHELAVHPCRNEQGDDCKIADEIVPVLDHGSG